MRPFGGGLGDACKPLGHFIQYWVYRLVRALLIFSALVLISLDTPCIQQVLVAFWSRFEGLERSRSSRMRVRAVWYVHLLVSTCLVHLTLL
ncbi:hypothetical protein EDC04DRAFT_2734107 [Pisolithus marmoratus]|nr:hypothetical protein EDC04DRAFT_2734107 [Pisolithus marmoratus]